MGMMQYNNPVIRLMVKAANMMIVSFYWVVCCLPVVTVLPACAALYHSVAGVVMGRGKGVTRDFSKALRASASMPFVSDMVEVDGIPCLDGGCAVKIPYQWALDNGFEKILVVRTRPQDYRRPPESKQFQELAERIYKNYPDLIRCLNTQSEQYNTAIEELEALQSQGRLLMLCPSGSIQVSTLEGDMERLGALYLLGRADAKLMLPQLRAYFEIPETN